MTRGTSKKIKKACARGAVLLMQAAHNKPVQRLLPALPAFNQTAAKAAPEGRVFDGAPMCTLFNFPVRTSHSRDFGHWVPEMLQHHDRNVCKHLSKEFCTQNSSCTHVSSAQYKCWLSGFWHSHICPESVSIQLDQLPIKSCNMQDVARYLLHMYASSTIIGLQHPTGLQYEDVSSA